MTNDETAIRMILDAHGAIVRDVRQLSRAELEAIVFCAICIGAHATMMPAQQMLASNVELARKLLTRLPSAEVPS